MSQSNLGMLQEYIQFAWMKLHKTPVLQATTWYSIGSFIEKGVSFLFAFIFASLLTPDEFGEVSIFITWVALLTPIITLNLYSSVQRAKFDLEEDKFKSFLSSITTLSLFISLLAIGIIRLIPETAFIDLFGIRKVFLTLAAIAASSTIGTQTYFARWRVNYQYRHYSLVSLFQTLAKLLLSLLLIFIFSRSDIFTPSEGRIFGIAKIDILIGLVFIIAALSGGKEKFNVDYWKYALGFALPLIPHTISGILLSQFDRILIGQILGKSETGAYSFAYQLGEPIRYIWLAINAAWVPWFFERMNQGEYALIRRRSHQYLNAFSVLTAMALIILPLLVTTLAPASYQNGLTILPLVMTSGYLTFLYSFYVNVEFFQKKTVYISIGTIIAAGANITLNIALLPTFGFIAAGWATLIAYFLQFIFHGYIVRWILKTRDIYPQKMILLQMTGVLILTLGIYGLLGWL